MDTPVVKFEHSPADSLADSFGSPGTSYPSLFDETETMNPSDVMTPGFDDDSVFDHSNTGTPAPEKKAVKKRKSWGQQLPEPKTNLPPRKRAKTEDEKEQRRVERVLRNRRAAQSSRERKRMEVEALESEKQQIERRAQELEMRLAESEAQNALLHQRIAQMSAGMTVFGQSSTHAPIQAPSPTFSQELFSSRDSMAQPSNSTTTTYTPPTEPVKTVNPASLSPEMRPVPETSNASLSDMTQHPAAMLCDLQCQSDEQRPWMSMATSSTSAILSCLLLISTATSAFLSPLSAIMTSLRTGSSLSPTASLLSTIIWLATTPTPLTTTISSSLSTLTTSARNLRSPRLSLRMNLLRRLLSCSPHLARPLMDATMGALRSASEQQRLTPGSVDGSGVSSAHRSGQPSIECIMTLLWAIHVIDREHRHEVSAPAADTLPGLEMGELFRPRPVSFVNSRVGPAGFEPMEKLAAARRWAFEESHP